MTAFTLVTTLATVLFIFVWSLIPVAYMVYRRRHPERHAASIFKMPGGVAMCWACPVFFAAVLVLLSLQADTRRADRQPGVVRAAGRGVPGASQNGEMTGNAGFRQRRKSRTSEIGRVDC